MTSEMRVFLRDIGKLPTCNIGFMTDDQSEY